MDYLKPPSVPTDNLYKFLAIAGLIVACVAFLYDEHSKGIDAEEANRLSDEMENRLLSLQHLTSYGIVYSQIERITPRFIVVDINEPFSEQHKQEERDLHQEYEDVLDRLTILPAYTDTEAKRWWMENMGIREQDWDAMVTNLQADTLLTHTVREAKALQKLKPTLTTLMVKRWAIKDNAAYRKQFLGYVCGVGVLVAGGGFWLWWRRLQRYQDAIVRRAAGVTNKPRRFWFTRKKTRQQRMPP